jgi:hypothetical protein
MSLGPRLRLEPTTRWLTIGHRRTCFYASISKQGRVRLLSVNQTQISFLGAKPCSETVAVNTEIQAPTETQELSCLLSLLKNTRHSGAYAINRRVVSSSPDQGAKPTRNSRV